LNSLQFSKDDRSFFNYAQSLFKQGSSAKAINVLNDLQTRFPASKYADDSQYLIGWINFQSSQFENAINSYGQLFSNYPNSTLLPIAYYSIGDSYFNLGEYQKAINAYSKLISEYENSPYVYDAVNGIQYCYIVQDKQSEAIEYLNQFIINNQNSPFLDKVQFKKGEIYYSSGEYTKAITEYSTLGGKYPDSKLVPASLFWMGKSSIMINKHEEAKDYFDEVLGFSKNSEIGFSALLELGKIYRGQEAYEQEIELYDENLPEITNPKRVSEIKYVKAENYILQNDLASAYQILNEIVNLRDGSLFYHKAEIELAILEMARSNFESSLYLLKDVTKNREDDIAAQAQYYIGLNYFQQEKLAEAITELKKLVSIYSAYGEWYIKGLMLLGDSYVKINDYASASEMYKSILKKHRNDKIAEEAKDKLNRL
jgi:TolA-binding protein